MARSTVELKSLREHGVEFESVGRDLSMKEHLSVEEIAERFHCNTETIRRRFRQAGGKPKTIWVFDDAE